MGSIDNVIFIISDVILKTYAGVSKITRLATWTTRTFVVTIHRNPLTCSQAIIIISLAINSTHRVMPGGAFTTTFFYTNAIVTGTAAPRHLITLLTKIVTVIISLALWMTT